MTSTSYKLRLLSRMYEQVSHVSWFPTGDGNVEQLQAKIETPDSRHGQKVWATQMAKRLNTAIAKVKAELMTEICAEIAAESARQVEIVQKEQEGGAE